MEIMETRIPVTVVMPVYHEQPSADEIKAIDNNLEKLAGRRVTFLVPESMDASLLQERYPQVPLTRVSDEWLGTKNGIAGYNRMMMSEEFYGLFSDSDYILICHTDAWIFRDELDRWMQEGHDIVAPPWPTRPRYRRFPLKQLIALRRRFSKGFFRAMMYDRVGNGGLSLRRVSACAGACRRYGNLIRSFLSHPGNPMQNEDVFWALVPEDFSYPTAAEALQFGFDYRPQLCYRLNGGHLPMGCHGFTKRRHRSFWSPFIP